jgi:hypothetical protein
MIYSKANSKDTGGESHYQVLLNGTRLEKGKAHLV